MKYSANVSWKRNSVPFNAKSYDRTHTIKLGSGSSFEASSAPEFVGNAELPNPEELFTASIASCFMLTFLYWTAMKGIIIDEYSLSAEATLAKNAEGKMAVTEVVLRPRIVFYQNNRPDSSVLQELFKKAHDNCFISSSVKTKIVIESEPVTTA